MPFEVNVTEVTRADPLAQKIKRFGRVVRGEAEPVVSARDGLQNLRITEAIVEPKRTGSIVDTTPAWASLKRHPVQRKEDL
jgi:predicted dehydrogenase